MTTAGRRPLILNAEVQRDNTSGPIHSFDSLILFSALAADVSDIGLLLMAPTG
ncbi:hypothetical protein [Rhodococcus koreensis]